MGSTPNSDDPPDFVLSFAGETGDTQLRTVRVRGRLRAPVHDQNMLVDILNRRGDPGSHLHDHDGELPAA